MDPQACFRIWLDAYPWTAGVDRRCAFDAESDLAEWRARGGFAPTDEEGREVVRLDLLQGGYWVKSDEGLAFVAYEGATIL